MSALLSTLIHNAQSERWTEDSLQKLALVELQGLAKLLGAPTGGNKAELVERLMLYRGVRMTLSGYADDPEPLAQAHKREALRAWCASVHLWKSGSKIQLAAGLLNWRNRCRAEGQAFLEQLKAEGQSRPQQLNLF